VIQLYSTSLSNALRPGYSLETLSQIFANASYPGVTGEYNPTVISSIKLADGTQYSFLCNSLGELAQITLPTGGVVQYDIFGILGGHPKSGQ
jgi:YD repeat-containing protein